MVLREPKQVMKAKAICKLWSEHRVGINQSQTSWAVCWGLPLAGMQLQSSFRTMSSTLEMLPLLSFEEVCVEGYKFWLEPYTALSDRDLWMGLLNAGSLET